MSSHTSMATKLLSDESTRDVFLTVVYELLKKDAGLACSALSARDVPIRRACGPFIPHIYLGGMHPLIPLPVQRNEGTG